MVMESVNCLHGYDRDCPDCDEPLVGPVTYVHDWPLAQCEAEAGHRRTYGGESSCACGAEPAGTHSCDTYGAW